mmetsp:Transcript_5545/g.14475  ORF Transcript_5545/g.14475 Transcript_5545/m.14475 type:complete len:205 (-) Transcript_5545:277-891(-)
MEDHQLCPRGRHARGLGGGLVKERALAEVLADVTEGHVLERLTHRLEDLDLAARDHEHRLGRAALTDEDAPGHHLLKGHARHDRLDLRERAVGEEGYLEEDGALGEDLELEVEALGQRGEHLVVSVVHASREVVKLLDVLLQHLGDAARLEVGVDVLALVGLLVEKLVNPDEGRAHLPDDDGVGDDGDDDDEHGAGRLEGVGGL